MSRTRSSSIGFVDTIGDNIHRITGYAQTSAFIMNTGITKRFRAYFIQMAGFMTQSDCHRYVRF